MVERNFHCNVACIFFLRQKAITPQRLNHGHMNVHGKPKTERSALCTYVNHFRKVRLCTTESPDSLLAYSWNPCNRHR